MKVEAIVSGEVARCDPETPLTEASRLMIADGIGSLAIFDNDQLVGLITERDVLKAVAKGSDTAVATVEQWMTARPDTVDQEMEIGDVADWMLAADYRHLPVEDGGKVVGIISIKDVLWHLRDRVY